MNQPSLEDRLRALEVEPNRYTRRIERVLHEIEAALAKGVSREAIVVALTGRRASTSR